MTATTFDARVAVHAGPLLGAFNRAGLVSAADVHVAQRLGRLSGEADERVLLAVALAVRGVRTGSVCIDLENLDALAVPESEDAAPVDGLPWPGRQDWRAAVLASPMVAVGAAGPVDRPVRWVDGRVYLDRYWRHEQVVRAEVDARVAAGVSGDGGSAAAGAARAAGAAAGGAAPDAAVLVDVLVDVLPDVLANEVRRLFPEADDSRQRLAAATAVLSRFTVLTGGPGTGKTTTVARVLAVLHAVAGPGLRVALAAPTGKAAARLQEAVQAQIRTLPEQDRARVGMPVAGTVHRLLGWRPGSSTRFRHDRHHHLPHDVVVVDETSMVSLPLMARLLEALRPEARLLLVGDPDQLASVEAGAVLGDLVGRPPVADRLPAALGSLLPGDLPSEPIERSRLRNGVVRLETVHRHGDDIGRLASAIRHGRADETLALLRSGGRAVDFVETAAELPTDAEVAGLRRDAESAGVELVSAAAAGDAPGALRALEAHRLLLAHRRGPAGVAHWAEQVESWVSAAVRARADPAASGAAFDPVAAPWYPGRPLLVTANDRDTGLYNGDTGVVVADDAGGVVAVFGDPAAPIRVRPHRLPVVETVYAMTVHRGQGSQFGAVSVLLPPAASPLLTRELLYTAVTRARERVRLVGSETAVRAAVERPIRRASGLRYPVPT